MRPKDADGMANSEDSDQAATDLGLHCLPRSIRNNMVCLVNHLNIKTVKQNLKPHK